MSRGEFRCKPGSRTALKFATVLTCLATLRRAFDSPRLQRPSSTCNVAVPTTNGGLLGQIQCKLPAYSLSGRRPRVPRLSVGHACPSLEKPRFHHSETPCIILIVAAHTGFRWLISLAGWIDRSDELVDSDSR